MESTNTPFLLRRWTENKHRFINAYTDRRQSFIPGLIPSTAVHLPLQETLQILAQRLGIPTLKTALDPEKTLPSPVAHLQDTDWIRRTNMVGVNVRTIGHFWNVVKYAFTLPSSQQGIHLLPIWEPGVVASLYGMASWNINPEFFSTELAVAHPHLDTVEKQLKVVVNLLHAMGKTVGMDVIPHTDRYSEIVLANPQFFEWLQRKNDRIIDHSANLHQKVQTYIFQFLQQRGPAGKDISLPDNAAIFFSEAFAEEQRLLALFGLPTDYYGRRLLRDDLIQALYEAGYEPTPATMGPPYRGLVVDPDESKAIIDHKGRIWRDYLITRPQEMSRVFGPLTRYKLYDCLDNNQNWAIDFDRPIPEVWNYISNRYADIQQVYNLDFMRGDMSHVQMRPQGVPVDCIPYYDIHQAVKNRIRKSAPYFAYFAESFLAPPNYMAYGDEIDHLEVSEAEVTLGDLQSMVIGSDKFLQHFRRYLDIAQTRSTRPCFTIMTGDKDDPRFDEFYLHGNEARFFISLFLTSLPSYMALGFECRDPHPVPAPNEHYTKLYVFRIAEGNKATQGPYVWGRNYELFERIDAIRFFAEDLMPYIDQTEVQWLLPPDPTGGQSVIAWTQAVEPRWLFIVNLHSEDLRTHLKIPWPEYPGIQQIFQLRFSTREKISGETLFKHRNGRLQIDRIHPGEGLALLKVEANS